MIESIKSVARRTSQSLREKFGRTDGTREDAELQEVIAKVHAMQHGGVAVRQRVEKAARLMEELSLTIQEMGNEYNRIPDLAPESRRLAVGVAEAGAALLECARACREVLTREAAEPLRGFAAQCTELKSAQERQHHCRLEYDFFHRKVLSLRASPPADFTRIPRNEQILENWRVDMWRARESSRALCSALYVSGRKTVDHSVLTAVRQLREFAEQVSLRFKTLFYHNTEATYPSEPVLSPEPLPPSSLLPFQHTGLPAGYTYVMPGARASDIVSSPSPTRRPLYIPPQGAVGASSLPILPQTDAAEERLDRRTTFPYVAAPPPVTATELGRASSPYQSPPALASTPREEGGGTRYQPPEIPFA